MHIFFKMSGKLIRLHCFTQRACGPATSNTQAFELTSGEMDAANALMALHETLGEVAGLESFARNTLVHLVQTPVQQGVQVDSGSSPSKQTSLMNFLKTDSVLKTFTGV